LRIQKNQKAKDSNDLNVTVVSHLKAEAIGWQLADQLKHFKIQEFRRLKIKDSAFKIT